MTIGCPVAVGLKSIAIFNPMHGLIGLEKVRQNQNGETAVYLHLQPGESTILKTYSKEKRGPSFHDIKPAGEPQLLTEIWKVTFSKGGPELPGDVETSELGSWTTRQDETYRSFSGMAKYSITFKNPRTGPLLLDLCMVCERADVTIDEQNLGTLFSPPFPVVIPANLLKPENALEINVANLMANRIAEMHRKNIPWKKFYNINLPSLLRENRGKKRAVYGGSLETTRGRFDWTG